MKENLDPEGYESFRQLPMCEVANTMLQIAKTLKLMHERGTDHGDIKPGQIFIDETSGAAYLGDLDVSGKPVIEPVDEKTDIYSLGNTFYYLMTGTKPSEDSPLDIRELNPSVSANLAELIKRCRNPDKEKRPDAGEMVDELEEYIAESKAQDPKYDIGGEEGGPSGR